MNIAWDYSRLARYYDKRTDYSESAISEFISLVLRDFKGSLRGADIGAGTGKLTKVLLDHKIQVSAVEPNDEMRAFGIQNTRGRRVAWSVGTGESTNLPSNSFELVTFGSSFNVTDRAKSLIEAARILVPMGWFACMWNHRDLDDKLQKEIEEIIKGQIPEYAYGSRREDQTAIISSSGLFLDAKIISRTSIHQIKKEDYIDAWKSHATLARQAGVKFEDVIRRIEVHLNNLDSISIPYTTRIWCAQLK